MTLKTTLARVSRNCLRGQPVPADLQSLWKANLADDADLLEEREFELVDELDDDFFEGYQEGDGLPYCIRAHQRMFDQIAFIARTMDGGILGYWMGEQKRAVADSPVVELDSEGQYELKGTSVAEYLLQLADSPEEFAEVREWLAERGIQVTAGRVEEIWARLKAFDDPNKQSWRYQDEERARDNG
jgi:hypothetical protein